MLASRFGFIVRDRPKQRKELENEGIIGNAVNTHYSYSYVNNVAPLVTEAVPQMISRIKAEGADVVLLVPV